MLRHLEVWSTEIAQSLRQKITPGTKGYLLLIKYLQLQMQDFFQINLKSLNVFHLLCVSVLTWKVQHQLN